MKTKLSHTPSFTLSVESQTLLKFLSALPVGSCISHEEMSNQIGGTDHRNTISTVRKRLADDFNIVLGSIHGQGYQILSAVKVLDKGDDFRARQLRANKNRVRELRTIEPESLPSDTEKSRYFQEVAHTSMIHAIHAKSQQKAINDGASKIKPRPGDTLTLSQLQSMFAPAISRE